MQDSNGVGNPGESTHRAHQQRIARVLATIPSTARVLSLNAPRGSALDQLALSWIGSRPVCSTPPGLQLLVHRFEQTTGLSTQLLAGACPAVIVRLDKEIGSGRALEEFLDQTSPVPLVLICNMAANATEMLQARKDTAVLLPDQLYYSRAEVERLFESMPNTSDAWAATAGWPKAMELFRLRAQARYGQNLNELRGCALAVKQWIGLQPTRFRQLVTRLSFLPSFDRAVVSAVLKGQSVPPKLGHELVRLGLAIPAGQPPESGIHRLHIPLLVADAIRTQTHATDIDGSKAIQKAVLETLASSGEPNQAVSYAMEVGHWSLAESLFRDYWAIAAMADPSALISGLKYFLRNNPQYPAQDDYLRTMAGTVANAMEETGAGQSHGYRLVPLPAVPHSTGQRPPSPLRSLRQEHSLALLVQLLSLRVHGQMTEAGKVAAVLAERVDSEPAARSGAEQAILYYQVALTRMLDADLRGAHAAYRKTLAITREEGFDQLHARCRLHLGLLEACQGLPDSWQGVGSDPRRDAVSAPRPGWPQQLIAGYRALWDLDERELARSLDADQGGSEAGELWPFEFFLRAAQEMLFGNRGRARQLINDRGAPAGVVHDGLAALLLTAADVLSLILDGYHTRALERCSAHGRDDLGFLTVLEAVALANRGDFTAAQQVAKRVGTTDRFGAQIRQMGSTLYGYCLAVRTGRPLDTVLSPTRSGDRALLSLVPLWLAGIEPEELSRALRVDDGPMRRLAGIRRQDRAAIRPLPQLTERETVVIRSLSRNMGRHEIAAHLHVSLNTVKSHISACYRKLGVNNLQDAVREAEHRGYL